MDEDELRKYKTDINQFPAEHERFCEILRQTDVRSYLEIGSNFGGSLWRVASILPVGSKLVSVDQPNIKNNNSKEILGLCIDELNAIGYDAHVIFGDSTRHDIVFAAAKYAPFDAVFIDANHSSSYVRADYKNYRQMAKKIIAFHDIAAVRPNKPEPIEVKTFWDEIKGVMPNTEEIILDETVTNGIGVIFL